MVLEALEMVIFVFLADLEEVLDDLATGLGGITTLGVLTGFGATSLPDTCFELLIGAEVLDG